MRSFYMVALACVGCGDRAAAPAQPAPEVRAVRVPEVPRDPAAKVWAGAPEHVARLMAQDVAEPKLLAAGAEFVRVRALNDGKTLVLRLSWDDATRDVLALAGRYGDMVAAQFPVEPGGQVPSAYMGEKDRPVHIHLFKAARALGGDPLEAYPNRRVDGYPWDAVPEASRAAEALRYAPAIAAGNLASTGGAVQDLLAEGFGTLTPAPQQRSEGAGGWKDGRWTVVIARPVAGTPSLEAGRRTYVAFAVWDGSAGNTGAKKMRSNWAPFVLEEK